MIVLLPGKSLGCRSLVGCSPWGSQELNTIERLHFQFSLFICIYTCDIDRYISYLSKRERTPVLCSFGKREDKAQLGEFLITSECNKEIWRFLYHFCNFSINFETVRIKLPKKKGKKTNKNRSSSIFFQHSVDCLVYPIW